MSEPWLPADILESPSARAGPAVRHPNHRGRRRHHSGRGAAALRRAAADRPPPSGTPTAVGAQGDLNRPVNGKLRQRTGPAEPLRLTFQVPRRYQITAMEPSGRYDRVEGTVMP